ncbi:Rieske (2Fe-2S) protein [Methanothrix sp.]|jgi:nitrite reductase/ring-hydroxylating ferredoxin subunit|uniref:Rieske (2Fe-2S) protein n=1 Tax=Methanothrix sp. TaxID=90426 RepID=UPI001BD1E89B
MFLRLCSIEEISPGEMRQFYLQGEEILVVNLEGRIYCLDARCSHAGAPLAEGSLQGEMLTCPWHYSQFRITDGSVLRGPATNPLRVYRTEIRDGQLFVDLLAPEI